jgi:hypothetical protein
MESVMKAKTLFRSLCFSAITVISGMSAADDIDIYLQTGFDVPKGDVSYWPTLMLAFDITSNATATFCQVDVTYTHSSGDYYFESTSADGDPSLTDGSYDPTTQTDDCQRLIDGDRARVLVPDPSDPECAVDPDDDDCTLILQDQEATVTYLNEFSLGGLPSDSADFSVTQQVKRVELYAMALRLATNEVLGNDTGLRIGMMLPHEQENANNAKSDGGFIPLGFGPTQAEVNTRASIADCTAVTAGSADDTTCGEAAMDELDDHFQDFVDIARNVSSLHRGQHGPANPWHDWGGAEMYLELYRYVGGGLTFRADKGLVDFSTSDAKNNRYPEPTIGGDGNIKSGFWDSIDDEFADTSLTVDGTPGGDPIEYDVSWDRGIIAVTKASGNEVVKTYIPPPLQCLGVNIVNFIHSQSSNSQPGTSGQNNDTAFYTAAANDTDCAANSSCGIGLTSALISAESNPNGVTKAVLRKMNLIDLIPEDVLEGIQGFDSYFIFNSSNPSTADMALATSGGGTGFGWGNLDELVEALKSVLLRILTQSSTFTAPALTANALNRTDILNDVFLALFQAETTPFWPGNIKKLRLAVQNPDTDPEDVVAGVPTVSGTTKTFTDAFVNGQIAADVTTYWTNVATLSDIDETVDKEATDTTDGRKVERGGAGQNIPGSRTIYTEGSGGTAGTLVTFNTTNSGLTTARVNFIYDPGDWDMGATLHSRPAAINYGFTTTSRETNDNPEVRLVFGSNDGLFRMLQNTNDTADDIELNGNVQSGVESWGFIPRELYGAIPRLRDESVPQSYPGIPITVDAPPLVIQVDRNGDGKFTEFEDDGVTATNDIVWAFFGLRRGGKFYYALNLLNPDSPEFMWKVGKNDSGNSVSTFTGSGTTAQPSDAFVELSQSWSTPQFAIMRVKDTNLPGNLCPTGDTECNVPVLAFGGGYNGDDYGLGGTTCTADLGDDVPNRDCTLDLTADDDEGNAVFIIHAETGALIWKLTDLPGSDTVAGYDPSRRALERADMVDSTPADLKFQDKDGDGLADTLYFGTTGGELWRINLTDMSLGDNGSLTQDDIDAHTFDDTDPERWRAFKMMSIGRHQSAALPGGGEDRRIQLQVGIASTRDDTGSYDAILLASGDREDPKATSGDDVFYLYKDEATGKRQAPYRRTSGGNDPNVWTSNDLPLNDQDLAWVNTSSQFISPNDPLVLTPDDPDLENGWRRAVTNPEDGEKVVGGSLIIGGIAFFTTYIPKDENSSNPCIPTAGTGRLYALDIGDGGPALDLNGDGTLDVFLPLETPGIPPPAISIGTGPGGGDTDKIYIQGKVIDTETRAFFPTFWRRDEE